MAALSTPITGSIGLLAVGSTQQLSNATPSGTWSSNATSIATVSSSGIVTGVAAGTATITYTVGSDTATLVFTTFALSYTNGLDISRLLPALIGRKGWRQPTSDSFKTSAGTAITLNTVNTSCTSGRYYQRDHAACDPQHLLNAQIDSGITEAEFNAYLTDLQTGVVMEALNTVFQQPSLIEKPKIIFEKSFRTSYQPITNSGKFCGWQIYTAKGDYTTKVDSVSFTATAPCTVKLYLYNDLRQQPLWSQTITVPVANDQTIVNIDDLYLSRLDDHHKGGIFYLGYYQQELEDQNVKGVDVYLNWWEDPLMFAYQGFEASSDYDAKTFVRDTYFSNYRTYGLGVELSTYSDFTNTVARQAHEFDNLVGLIMIQKCIEEVMNSGRSNGDMRVSQQLMNSMYEALNGIPYYKGGDVAGHNYKTGIKNKIEREVMRVQNTFLPQPKPMSLIPPVNDYRSDLVNWGNMIPMYP